MAVIVVVHDLVQSHYRQRRERTERRVHRRRLDDDEHANSYIGSTGIGSGTLNLGVANAVPVVSAISFAGAPFEYGAVQPDLRRADTTVGTGATAVASVVGTGTLTISNTAGTFQMNTNTSGSTTLNLSRSGAFRPTSASSDVGINPANSTAGAATLLLSPSNTIVTPTLYVSKGPNNASGQTASIVLGRTISAWAI